MVKDKHENQYRLHLCSILMNEMDFKTISTIFNPDRNMDVKESKAG